MTGRKGTCGVFAALALLAVACASDPTSGSPQVAGEPVYLFTAPEPGYFATIGEMFDESPLVVLGEVVKVERGEPMSEGAHPDEDSFLVMGLYTVRVTEALKGTPDPTIIVRRTSFSQSGDELRPVALEGILPNEVGDSVFWFLEESDGSPGMLQAFRLQGIFEVRDGMVVSELNVEHGPAHQVDGRLLADVLDLLAEGS